MGEAVSACLARRISNSRAVLPWGSCSAASLKRAGKALFLSIRERRERNWRSHHRLANKIDKTLLVILRYLIVFQMRIFQPFPLLRRLIGLVVKAN